MKYWNRADNLKHHRRRDDHFVFSNSFFFTFIIQIIFLYKFLIDFVDFELAPVGYFLIDMKYSVYLYQLVHTLTVGKRHLPYSK